MPPPYILPGDGTTFKMKIGAVFTQIGLVHEVDGPGFDIAPIPTTTLLSTLHTNRPSRLPKPDKCTVKFFFDPNDTAVHVILLGRTTNPGPIDDFEMDFNDDNTTHARANFSAFVTKFKISGVKVEENISADVELMLTTAVTFTPGTP